MQSDILNAYKFQRSDNRNRPATLALRMARDDIAAGRKRYGAKDAAVAVAPWKVGSTEVRTLEGYNALGLRFVGWCDELAPRLVEHRGWFTRSDDFGEVARGAVFLLPGKDGRARAVPGFVECENGKPINDETATIALSSIHDIEPDSYSPDYHDAIIAADRLAERYAEDAREYDTAWQAGSRHADNMEQIAKARAEARKVAAAARDNVKNNPVICATLRDKVRELREHIRELCDENEKLRDGDFSRRDYSLQFWTGDARLRAAFNDGAGGEVLK